MHFTEYDTRLAAYAAIVDEQDRLLLTLWNGEGRYAPGWTMPGGGVEFEEQVEEAVVREVFEETGFHVEVGPLLMVDSWGRTAAENDGERGFKAVRIVHLALITGGTLGTTEIGGSTDEARWFPIDAIADLNTTSLVDAVVDALAAQRV